LAAAVASVVLLAPSDGWAEPRAEARAKLVQGSEFLKRREFEEALARFQEAYRLVPSPKIQYNFGLAYRGLGRKADAMEAFDRFLSEAPDAPKESRQTAERERAELLGQVTVLEVKVDLAGAEVFIDGRSYGTTHTNHIYLDPGPHQLSVEKAGEGPAFTERINATAGQRMTVMARLARAPTPPPPAHDSSPPQALPEPVPPRGHDEPPPPQEPMRWQPIAGWASAGAAVVAAGFGGYEVMSSNSKFSDFNHRSDCGEIRENRGGPACAALYDDATSARQKAYVGFAVAGAFAAASVVFFVLTPEKSAGGSVAVACAPSFVNPGLSCAARF
jgi:tetratricopeptide (TPR) repeat protein